MPILADATDKEGTASFWLEVSRIGEDAVARLKALEAPADGRDVLDGSISSFEEAFSLMRDYAAAFPADDAEAANFLQKTRFQTDTGRLAARDYGLDVCAELASGAVLFPPRVEFPTGTFERGDGPQRIQSNADGTFTYYLSPDVIDVTGTYSVMAIGTPRKATTMLSARTSRRALPTSEPSMVRR